MDAKFKQLIKSRGYELVGAFDTVQRDPLLITAPFQKKGKWGKIDNHGKVVEEAKSTEYVAATPQRDIKGDPFLNESDRGTKYGTPTFPSKNIFSKFSKNGKHGTRDASEKEGISPIYDQVILYNDSTVYVKNGNLYGVFNANGKPIVPVMYDYITYTSNSSQAFIVKTGKLYGVFFKGKEIIPVQYDRIGFDYRKKNLIKVTTGDKTALFNLTGAQLTAFSYNQIGDFNATGIATYRIGVSTDAKMGLIDSLGKPVTTREYREIVSFSPLLFKVTDGIYPNQQTGLINLKGKPVSQMDYNQIEYLNKGVARVTKDGQIGMIDSTGKEVIKPEYTYLNYFSNGFAIFKRDTKYGLLNSKGTVVVPPAYDLIESNYSRQCYFIIMDKKSGIMDATGKILLPPTYDLLYPVADHGYRASLNKKVGLLNDNGAVVIPIKYDMIGPDRGNKVVDHGIATATLNGKKYHLDLYGNEYSETLPAETMLNFTPDKSGFVTGADFQQFIKQRGFQLVSTFDTLTKKPLLLACRVMLDGKWKLMDTKGVYHDDPDRAHPYIYDEAKITSGTGMGSDIRIDEPVNAENPVNPGFEQVVENGKYGTINKKTNKIGLPAIYDNFTFMGGGWVMIRLGGKYGMAMDDGKVILSPKYESITPMTANGRFNFQCFFVRDNGKYGLVSSSGAEIIPIKYDKLQNIYGVDPNNSLLKFSLDNKWGIITKNGKMLTQPLYNELMNIRPNLIKTTIGASYPRLYGLIDTTGKEILPPVYKAIDPDFHKKVFRITNANDKIGYLSLTGKILFKPVYDEVGEFTNGTARVKINGKYGLMKENESFAIQPIYDDLYLTRAGQTVILQTGNKKGVADMQGNKIIPIEYSELYAANGNYIFKRDEKWGIMNAKGKVLASLEYDNISPGYNCFIVSSNMKYGLMANDGKLITGVKYDRFRSESFTMKSGFAETKLNGARVIIDRYGNEYFGLGTGYNN